MDNINNTLIDTSDVNGRYAFNGVAPGFYNVQAVHLVQRTSLLVTGIEVADDTTVVPPATLLETGTIRLLLPSNFIPENGYAYVPGTDIAVFFTNDVIEIVLDSVPSGRIPEIRYVITDDTTAISKLDVIVLPADTITIANPSWKYMRRVYLNTSSSGAGIEGDVHGFPVLVRLSANTFDFTQAKIKGEDIRFSSSHGSPLIHEIEVWDADAKSAEIWVKVDTIYGNDSTQAIVMYWGNDTAVDASYSMAVFDTAAGFQGVWHLDGKGNDTALDATANHFDGITYHIYGTSPASGAIGNARAFDGDSSYITMPNTASSKLNFTEDGYFTVSAWVYADTFDNVYRTTVIKGFEQYFLQLSYFPGNEPLWQFSVFREDDNWNMSHTPAVEKEWVQITGVRQGSDQYLYCNGELVANISAIYDQDTLRDTSNDLSIGRFLKEATFPAKFGYCFFKGMIDEVRISSVDRNSDWIRLSYMNQRRDDKLVQFK